MRINKNVEDLIYEAYSLGIDQGIDYGNDINFDKSERYFLLKDKINSLKMSDQVKGSTKNE